MDNNFSAENYTALCDQLALRDQDLCSVMDRYGYPPMWTRPNTFETLVHIILEQQVSLAAARSALNKLHEKLGSIEPEKLLQLTDEELKSCYFSRQKARYVRHLAEEIAYKGLSLSSMEEMTDEEVRTKLIQLKGIGNWTIDVYLMFTLQRADIFPVGDLAAVNALKEIKHLPKDTDRSQIIGIAEQWRPYRTIATMILWHFYLSKRKPLVI